MDEMAPVVLLIFNRPGKTAGVFQAISEAKPRQLLVVADGPRPWVAGDREKVSQCREIVKNVDWQCDVLTNYSDVNMGCRDRVRTGLDWAFAQVDRAIILEDDCIPVPSFFEFCTTLLERHANDRSVTHICGTNPLADQLNASTDLAYFKSEFFFIWGWATWANRWKECYEAEFTGLYHPKTLGALWRLHGWNAIYWMRIFLKTRWGHLNTWDHQWSYGNWIRQKKSLVPTLNLVTNVGFDEEATHTRSAEGPLAGLRVRTVAAGFGDRLMCVEKNTDYHRLFSPKWTWPWR